MNFQFENISIWWVNCPSTGFKWRSVSHKHWYIYFIQYIYQYMLGYIHISKHWYIYFQAWDIYISEHWMRSFEEGKTILSPLPWTVDMAITYVGTCFFNCYDSNIHSNVLELVFFNGCDSKIHSNVLELVFFTVTIARFIPMCWNLFF